MDTTKPAVQIFYGKYLDKIDNEIPAEHIDPYKNRSFQLTLEPGKPNFSTTDSTRITLENMDAEGNLLYPKQWFIDNSRSEAEGATYPFELFFRVYVWGEAAFTGIYSDKNYSVNGDTVDVEMNDLTGLLDKKVPALKVFQYENVSVASVNNQSADYPIGSGTALDGKALNQQALLIPLEETSLYTDFESYKDAVNQLPLMAHLGFEFDDFGFNLIVADNDLLESESQDLPPFSAYVKIGEQTILTRCHIEGRHYKGDADPATGEIEIQNKFRLYIRVIHANNSDFVEDDYVVLQRGRFFKNEQGDDLSSGDKVDITIWSPDRGNDPDVLLKSGDIFNQIGNADNAFIHGLTWIYDGATDNYVIQESLSGYDYLDVFELTLDSINTYFSNFYETPANADFFDITKAGTSGRKAFIADAIMYGWIGEDNDIQDLLTNLARQTNCFLYMNAMGKIVYQSRAQYQDDYYSETIPAGAVDLDEYPFQWNQGESEDFGFDTFEIEEPLDLVEINNLVSDDKQVKFVNTEGVTSSPGIRSTSLKVSHFRIYNLAVPDTRYVDHFGLWRRSPSDPTFPFYTSSLIDEFIQTPVDLATKYAKGFSWPTEFIYPKLPGQFFPDVAEGGLMHRTKDGMVQVFLVTKITRSSDLFKSIELKLEAEWGV